LRPLTPVPQAVVIDYEDYCAVMGVARDATQEEIKQGSRKLVRKYDPDVSKAADSAPGGRARR